MKNRNANTFNRPAKDLKRVVIRKLRLFRALTERIGFRTRSKRISVIFPQPVSSPITISNIPMLTIKKSRRFHQSRKYDFLWNTKPIAITLRINSTVNSHVKTVPEVLTNLSKSVSQQLQFIRFSQFSIVMIIEFRIIEKVMKYLNHFHSTIQTTQ